MPNQPAQEKRTCATCGDRTRKWTKIETGYQCENCAPPSEKGAEEMRKKKAITHPVTGKTFNGGPSVAVCDNCLRRAQGLGHFVMERP